MSSFLFTTIAAVVGVVVLAPSYATNIPTTNPGCTTTVLGADNVANGSASLEPDFSANTINTTWYSNGTQLTGNNIPATCTYDDTLVPPTPAPRAGYAFNGWTLMPSSPFSRFNTNTSGTSSNYESFSNINNGDGYPAPAAGTWTVAFPYGTISGIAECKNSSGGTTEECPDYNEEMDMCYVEGLPTESLGLDHCYCRIIGYTLSGGSYQSENSLSPVYAGYIPGSNQGMGNTITSNCLGTGYGTVYDANYNDIGYGNCASYCAYRIENDANFRAQLYGQSQ